MFGLNNISSPQLDCVLWLISHWPYSGATHILGGESLVWIVPLFLILTAVTRLLIQSGSRQGVVRRMRHKHSPGEHCVAPVLMCLLVSVKTTGVVCRCVYSTVVQCVQCVHQHHRPGTHTGISVQNYNGI